MFKVMTAAAIGLVVGGVGAMAWSQLNVSEAPRVCLVPASIDDNLKQGMLKQEALKVIGCPGKQVGKDDYVFDMEGGLRFLVVFQGGRPYVTGPT